LVLVEIRPCHLGCFLASSFRKEGLRQPGLAISCFRVVCTGARQTFQDIEEYSLGIAPPTQVIERARKTPSRFQSQQVVLAEDPRLLLDNFAKDGFGVHRIALQESRYR
jgi:hypothetical protein